MWKPTQFDENCAALLAAAPKRHSRHCLRSALKHLELASKLTTADPAMAIFRAITAEEEAASGIMHVLKERGYENAGHLRVRDHVHKNALIPFLAILGQFFHELLGVHDFEPKLHIKDEDGQRRLTVALPMTINGEIRLAYPIPPLNFSVSSEERRLSYRRQVEAFVAKQGARDITAHIREQANLRNKVLYAGPDGYPVIREVKEEFLLLRARKVHALLKAYLLIFPYNERQPFVQDALDAFLNMLGIVDVPDLHKEIHPWSLGPHGKARMARSLADTDGTPEKSIWGRK
jgi:hypothetical protein